MSSWSQGFCMIYHIVGCYHFMCCSESGRDGWFALLYHYNVRDARNSLFHLAETEVQFGRFGEIMDCVQHLIDETGSILPKEFCDDCRKQLKTLASSECAVCCGFVYCSESYTGDCRIFATWKRIANHIRAVPFTNQNPWNGLHVAKIPQSPVTSPIPKVLIGGHDPPLCFTCCKDSTISCTVYGTNLQNSIYNNLNVHNY